MPELADLSATELRRLYLAGETRPSEVIEAVLQRADAWEPRIHAFTQVDVDTARESARRADERYAKSEPRGVLDGIPVTVKENIATAGDPYRMGSAATPETISDADAPAAARLKEDGAVIFAKTTMPDFGMMSSGVSSLHPTTRSPWNPDWNPGGSSAGAGAAAAAGIGPIHLGTDIGGSVRMPAGWCGVAGLKPSFGRIPVSPPYYGRCIGPLARTTEDLALTMSVVSRPDDRDHMSLPAAELDWTGLTALPLDGVRIGVCTDAGAGPAPDPQIADAIHQAAHAFEGAGATTEPVASLIDQALLDGLDRFWRMRSFLDLQALGVEAAARALPHILDWTTPAAQFTAEQVFTGFSAMDGMAMSVARAFGDLDFLLAPVAPIPAFSADAPAPFGADQALMHVGFTAPFNMSGHPAISVPWTTCDDGRPIPIQLVARRHRDLDALRLGLAAEQLRPPQPAWPS
ncbi:MAG TPA: amidase [Solirubrobacteraceae bacterium]|jgi:aspartyl-tRNA(Asn)/glutamyl-tRNA(Gln) amidotransferase subunit A